MGRLASRALFMLMLGALGACSDAEPVSGQTQHLLPVDEADRDPSFFLFRSRLIEAVAARDTSFLVAHVAPDIAIGFGGGGGIADFRAQWQLSDANSELWPVLTRILSRGGLFQSGGEAADSRRFVAPYTFAAFPDDADAYASVVVAGENVRVRAQPGAEASVVDTLSYAIVTAPGAEPGDAPVPDGWRRILLPSGEQGFIASTYVVHPLDFRAGFEKREGRWMMTYLVAGD